MDRRKFIFGACAVAIATAIPPTIALSQAPSIYFLGDSRVEGLWSTYAEISDGIHQNVIRQPEFDRLALNAWAGMFGGDIEMGVNEQGAANGPS